MGVEESPNRNEGDGSPELTLLRVPAVGFAELNLRVATVKTRVVDFGIRVHLVLHSLSPKALRVPK